MVPSLQVVLIGMIKSNRFTDKGTLIKNPIMNSEMHYTFLCWNTYEVTAGNCVIFVKVSSYRVQCLISIAQST